MTNLEEAKKFFSADSYACEVTGIEILEVREHYAKCRLKIDRRHKNAVGQVMGGVAYTLADFVFAVATNDTDSMTVTSVSQISYLHTCRGEYLIGDCEMLKDGKRQCFYRIDIRDETGELIAVVNTNGTHLGKKPEEHKERNRHNEL